MQRVGSKNGNFLKGRANSAGSSLVKKVSLDKESKKKNICKQLCALEWD